MVGGKFSEEPDNMLYEPEKDTTDSSLLEESSLRCRLSEDTQRMLREDVFNGDLSPMEVMDYHVHIVGHNDHGSECFIHPSAQTWWHPFKRLKSAILMSASQVANKENGDMEYISRLIRLVKNYCPASILGGNHGGSHDYLSPHLCLLPFDKFYSKTGEADLEQTTFYVPNDYSIKMATEFPNFFHPFGSVNPYRKDALEELKYCADHGVRVIKWLPNSMGINPSDNQCEAFYQKMKELDMALLVHVGDEHTVSAGFLDNTLGNPLLLRKPLDCGVKVIAAHCASEGKGEDLDSPARRKPHVSNYSLLRRLMDDPKYDKLLYADISALVGILRVPVLKEVLEDKAIHNRLVYGSDYPLPCVNALTFMRQLTYHNLIQPHQVPCLNELYNYNPLLYDIALKRLVRGPNGGQFPASVFKKHPDIPPVGLASTPGGTSV